MRARDRDLVAGVLAAIALLLGAGAWMGGQVAPGITLDVENGPLKSDARIVVSGVDPSGPAARSGIEVGMVVVSINGVAILPLPGWDPNAKVEVQNEADGSTSLVPFSPEPTPVVAQPDGPVLGHLLNEPIYNLSAVRPDLLTQPLEPDSYIAVGFNVADWSSSIQAGFVAWGIGLAILLLGGWWLATGRAGRSVQGLAIPAVTATAVPLVLCSFRAIGGPGPYAISSIVAAAALLPLADGLIARNPLRTQRITLQIGAVLLAACAATLGGVVEFLTDFPNRALVLWWLSASAITVVPGILAARPTAPAAAEPHATPSGRLLDATEFAVLGLTPAIAFFSFLQPQGEPIVQPILIWFVAILVAGRFTVRPLVRLATRAQLQRDLVVATMEAERARIATNIHDDALQDVTLLVRRLDDAGDPEGAELARGVADRLRTISGDLRLPILDDLGVGPALDWLVGRTERMAGGEVRLELADGMRPPPAVELAVFRIAQEALTNAVKHGRPPIVVRYRAVDTGISLSVDDAGPGIEPGAAEDAPASGHFGILGMSQRAEQIGAILDVRRWPTGGTHVALEWRPR